MLPTYSILYAKWWLVFIQLRYGVGIETRKKKVDYNNEACRFQRKNGSHRREDEEEEALEISIKEPATGKFNVRLVQEKKEENVWRTPW